MSHFLFVVEVPQNAPGSLMAGIGNNWFEFENESKTILKDAKGCLSLQGNAWLFPADNALKVLLLLSNAADKLKLKYSALLIDNYTDLSEIKRKIAGSFNK